MGNTFAPTTLTRGSYYNYHTFATAINLLLLLPPAPRIMQKQYEHAKTPYSMK